ncbi:DUF1127 domain-containing protein [Terrihabitans sp. B22-R8]|uniref:DUF1127 domain-containing protein n=1 Tax=Terrihabitans sp. B22-R8 TaxID=3425128 RepID=UPI00403CD7D7
MTHTTNVAWVAPGLASFHLRDFARAIGAAFQAILNRYSAGRALAGFDQRMLADIGLTEADVSSAFSEPLWRDPTLRLSVLAVERRTARVRRKQSAASLATSRQGLAATC